MANLPEIQTRMQLEIDEKIGGAEPRLKDKDQLHYVNAVSVYFSSCVHLRPFPVRLRTTSVFAGSP